MGFEDLGKSFWVQDFYEYWSYEKALFTDFSEIETENRISIKLLKLRKQSEKPFLNNLARLKWKITKWAYRILTFTK